MKNDAFRPFLMNIVENVSILFADIVGFTEMSQVDNKMKLPNERALRTNEQVDLNSNFQMRRP